MLAYINLMIKQETEKAGLSNDYSVVDALNQLKLRYQQEVYRRFGRLHIGECGKHLGRFVPHETLRREHEKNSLQHRNRENHERGFLRSALQAIRR